MCNDLSVNMYYYEITHILPKNFKFMFLIYIKNLNSYKQVHALPVGYIALYGLGFVHIKALTIQGKVFPDF